MAGKAVYWLKNLLNETGQGEQVGRATGDHKSLLPSGRR